MITAEMKRKIDQVWSSFWAAGISNPLEIIEQITCLVHLRRLEELYPGTDGSSQPLIYRASTERLRWSKLTEEAPQRMLAIVRDDVVAWLRDLSYRFPDHFGQFKSVRFTITTPSLLMRAVDLVNDFDISEASTAGALYEHLLGKIDGNSGHLRTPRDVVELLVQMTKPGRADDICDPFCGTGELLLAAGQFVKRSDVGGPSEGVLRGFSAHSGFLPITEMNLALYGVAQPDLRSVDPLSRDADGLGEYSLILANPPFGGYYDYDRLSDVLRMYAGTRKTELLYLAGILRWLKPGGRAGVVVPDGSALRKYLGSSRDSAHSCGEAQAGRRGELAQGGFPAVLGSAGIATVLHQNGPHGLRVVLRHDRRGMGARRRPRLDVGRRCIEVAEARQLGAQENSGRSELLRTGGGHRRQRVRAHASPLPARARDEEARSRRCVAPRRHRRGDRGKGADLVGGQRRRRHRGG
nr:N-6 DNA methylase [Longimycelium tulufanense]